MAQTISITSGNKTITAVYYVKDGVITVATTSGNKSTQVSGLEAEHLAKILLRELISEGKVK